MSKDNRPIEEIIDKLLAAPFLKPISNLKVLRVEAKRAIEAWVEVEIIGSDEYHVGENHWEISEAEEARNKLRASQRARLRGKHE